MWYICIKYEESNHFVRNEFCILNSSLKGFFFCKILQKKGDKTYATASVLHALIIIIIRICMYSGLWKKFIKWLLRIPFQLLHKRLLCAWGYEMCRVILNLCVITKKECGYQEKVSETGLFRLRAVTLP